ncbi:class I SAM-dependent methyltransferase [Streptomyces sp. NPDC001389]|uniref:class I SAM-dependent methyltransferase n=1 Tax=Streptomyces sp. NPDC001389 TaxID=3364569 RepID=UPI0036CDB19C
MTTPASGPFATAEPYYAQHRPGWDSRLFTHLRHRLDLDETSHVLDLGCGPGTIAIPMAAFVGTITAIDPEPGMIAQGRRIAGEHGADHIRWVLGSSTDLTDLQLPAITCTTIGRAFHWMNRAQTLRDLDRLTIPGGAVVLVGNGRRGKDVEIPQWQHVIDDVLASILGPGRREQVYTRTEETQREALLRSPFSRLETIHWDNVVTRSLDEVVGLQLSYAHTSPAQLGNQRAAFERAMRSELTALHPDGEFTESVRTEAVLAVRP